jgi:hypothetical protein
MVIGRGALIGMMWAARAGLEDVEMIARNVILTHAEMIENIALTKGENWTAMTGRNSIIRIVHTTSITMKIGGDILSLSKKSALERKMATA